MDKELQKERTEIINNSIREAYGNDAAITVINGRKSLKDKNVPDFVMLFQKIGKELAKKLTPAGCKVLLYFYSMMQYSEHIGCDQQTLAEELELSIRSVNGAVKELKDMFVIISYQDPQDKRRQVYMINPHTAWKGDLGIRKQFLAKQDKSQYKLPFEATT